jgi:hypothetical protein
MKDIKDTQEVLSYDQLSHFATVMHVMANRQSGTENALLLHKIRMNMYYAGIRENIVIGDDIIIPELTKDEWLTLGGQLQKRASLVKSTQSAYLWSAAREIRRFLYTNFQLTSVVKL